MEHEILEMVDQVKIVERRVEESLKCSGREREGGEERLRLL